MKGERNKTYAQIVQLGQFGAELREKKKVLDNEIGILLSSSDAKEQ